MELEKNTMEKLQLLFEKYALSGQDINSYLDGLLISNYLPYWDYISVDTLLTLQKPRTDFPDEVIFIVYHQITELYFKLCLHEYHQIAHNGRIVLENGQDVGWKDKLEASFFIERVNRINRYFEALTKSFEIMINGMEKEQFLRFRMALLPASGFQSAQYRLIEMASTPMINLVDKEHREKLKNADIEKMYEHIYWKKGAIEISSGKKTYTLIQFEKKYEKQFIEWAKYYADKNLWLKYLSLPETDRQNKSIIQALKNLDLNVNVRWPLVHYKSAVRYLQQENKDVAATGGTNWQKYLPPRFQKRIFFPELWTNEEKENWGTFTELSVVS
ncbi:MAG: tryptophan 2,3-dioxygenase family protein [Bacteroidia bacterium]|nr:tryptophan 2,3-dioxygenase family protein [Bacteroidia bacterium]